MRLLIAARRDGRTHLPGSRRRPVAPRTTAPTRLSSLARRPPRASRRRSSRAAGIPLRRLAAALAAHDRARRPRRPRPDPARRCRSPQAAAILAAERPGGDLHDRRLRRDPGPAWRRAPLGIPVVLWDGNVIPGRAVRATARLAAALAVSFEATVPRARAARRRAVLRDRHADPRPRRDRPRDAARGRLGIAGRRAGRSSSSAARRPSGGSTPPWPRRCRGSSSG